MDKENGLLDDLDPSAGAGQPGSEGGAEPPKTPEVAPGPGEAQPDAERRSGDVTVALRQAREEAKAERKRREELEGRYGQLKSSTDTLLERLIADRRGAEPEAKAADDDPAPVGDPSDPKYDPIARLEWVTRQYDKLSKTQREREEQHRQQTEHQQAFSHALMAVQTRWTQAAAERPELIDAYNYTLQSFARELAVNGAQGMLPNGTVMPNSPLDHALKQHEASIIAYCFQNNIAIEDYFVNLAMSRNWRPPEPEAAEPIEGETEEAKSQRERDEKGRFVSDADKEKAAKLAASQNANRSLSQGAGAPSKKMSDKELAEMSEEDMWATFRKNGGKGFDKEMNFR